MSGSATPPMMNDARFNFGPLRASIEPSSERSAVMKLPDTSQVRLEKQEAAQQQEVSKEQRFIARQHGGASLFVRMWAYGGPRQQLSALALDSDAELTDLIRKLIADVHGQITERWPEGLVARFSEPLFALSAAKKLQQRLLTFQRPSPPQQVVASVLICGRNEQAGSADHAAVIATAQMLADGSYSAQILVSEGIYELAQHEPGFHFSSKPVREAGDSGMAEAIYELLWTDESTYGHLREAGQSTGIHTAGRYQIQSELGRGAMGVVYKAYDQLIGRTVALKTISIDRNAPNRKELIERLKQEAKAAGGLDHPNIITIYDVGQEDDRVYLSMQFLEGKTLQTLLAEDELPSLATLISYAEQICSAVGFAHSRSVIHRDLKPANLMLTTQGIIKVLDFGIAKLQDATLTQTGLVVGTPSHMAPEQASDRKIDHRTDIFALGSVFYELFTREKPFKGDVTTVLYKIVHEDPVPPSVINPGLPGGIDAIVRKALAKNPKDRFQSCEEMGKAFAEQAALLKTTPSASVAFAASTQPAPTPGATAASLNYLLETTTLRPQRNRWLPVTLVFLTAMIAVGGWAFYMKSQTGSFPPIIQKAVSGIRQRIPSKSGYERAGTDGHPQESAQEASGQSTSEPKPASSAAPSTTTTAQPPAENSAPLSSVAAPVSSGAPAEPTQPGTARDASAQGSSNPAQTTSTNTNTVTAAQTAANPEPASSAQGNESESTTEQPKPRPAKRSVSEPAAARVDGFTRRDVPELLKQADAAARRGDNRLAVYEYNLILKLDRNNADARAGLRSVQAPK
jgi:serine/threonine protein kinase